MYIRANIGGAYRWDAAAQLWVPVTDWITAADWSLSGVESVALDPTDPNRVYLVAGMYLRWSPIDAAILISTNRGKTFDRVNLPIMMGGNDTGQQTGERLAVNPFNPAQLYLATHLNGLWQSTDDGAKLDGRSSEFSDSVLDGRRRVVVRSLRSAATRARSTWGRTRGALYRSTDGGATWPRDARPARDLWRTARHFGPCAARWARMASLYVSYANRAGLADISNGAVYKFYPDGR
jgi:photosystem II stability/assembly factor-like uncharacterized protein